MIQVTVLYPAGPAFDMDYYLNRHTPMLQQRLGAALTSIAIETATLCIAPGGPPPYQVVCRLGFDSMDTLGAALAEHGAAIMGDIPNYTAAQPVIQVGEAKI